MKKTLTLLLSTSALAAAIALPASGSLLASGDDGFATSSDRAAAQPVWTRILASNDDYGDDDYGDDDHEDDDDDEEDDDDEGGRRPAPAGSTTPPNNGLFGTGDTSAVEMK